MGLLRKISSAINPGGKTLGEINKEVAGSQQTHIPEELEIEITAEYRHIKDLINENNKLIFVTGGAGTGKSTFVKWIDKEFSGKVLIAAPTGIAALTVSGTTIHRLCRFPPAWLVDEDIKVDPRSVIPKIEILIIDEISMVNANLLDAVDKYCQVNRKNEQAFGGLTVIMVGDLFQLPPIVQRTLKPFFAREYTSPKFFAARAVSSSTLVGVELTTPFRQKDQNLIPLLANIREGTDLTATVQGFNDSCVMTSTPPAGAVHLAPRNRDVETINASKLEELPLPEFDYEGVLKGKFPENQLPVENRILLRAGAQVVFASNSKYWVNGNIGIVETVAANKVTVKLLDSGNIVTVSHYEWKQYEYRYEESEKRVYRAEVGSYTQIPLGLAWAMTIHKSQGLTLDKVHLDLGAGAFETGQTYVALSRSRSLAAITLARKLSIAEIKVDREAVAFYGAIRGG
jgi:ATP-dependent DNA helicase PIF1